MIGEEQFPVVGIGASAGGIQALKTFFTEVPKDSGMAYVVILHMSPEHESRLAEILQTTSQIPITQVRKRIKVEPNHAYVIPPTRNLAMADGHLDLKSKIGAEERRSPVDLFFRTLAETKEDQAVSVVLSGTGTDGSMGLKRIKENGGVAFVQDPTEADYNDMPRNAINTGMVDFVLPVAQIPAKIISYKEHLGAVQLPEPATQVPKTDEQALLDIFSQLRLRTGHDFSNYKRATLLRRIERRLGLRELLGLSAYSRYLREQPQEVQALMKDLLISVTNFFRDPESVETLGKEIIPRILENKKAGEPVRVWIAGCATGEEAYTFAMMFSEHIKAAGEAIKLQVFATDLDEQSIQIAREGFYKESEIADVSPERLERFFNRQADGYRVKRELRESVLFAVHNLIKDTPFSHLDLISCRNLLIYLNRTAHRRVLEVAHFALNPAGYLFLGNSESIESAHDLFTVVDKDHHIYRSRPVQPRAYPLPDIATRPLPSIPSEKTSAETHAFERLTYVDLHRRLLEQYGPPSVVVNEDYEIIHLSDRAGLYLQFQGGEPTQNLIQLARESIRLELRTALYQAVHEGINVEARGLRVVTDQGTKIVNIKVRPVLRENDLTRGFILVLFEEADPDQVEKTPSRIVSSDEPIAQRLGEELTQLKGQMRTTIEQHESQQEELRASNEELQAMNEELRSLAEELETSREELQSINEELSTVNQELKIKIEELNLANNNFQNLMNSTDIGTIFLDRALRIRNFTPRIRETFNLISNDIGRPLMDIRSKVKLDDLLAQMDDVVDGLQTIEREVKTSDDHTYQMRLSPYRTLDDKVDGLVITMVDVTDRARAEDIVRQASDALEDKVLERTAELGASNEALRQEVDSKERSEKARSKLLKQLVNAQEEERRRLARDLHDQLGQQLTALKLKLNSLKHATEDRQAATLEELEAIVQQLDTDVDFLAWEVRPIALDELGLETALSNYTKQWGEHFNIAAEFHARGLEQRLATEIESNLYRVAQEALNNCAKHSKCTRAAVILERRDHHAVLIIEDNGIGFDTGEQNSPRQMGLVGMRERALLIGGSFDVESTPKKGTTLFVRVPLTGEGGPSF